MDQCTRGALPEGSRELPELQTGNILVAVCPYICPYLCPYTCLEVPVMWQSPEAPTVLSPCPWPQGMLPSLLPKDSRAVVALRMMTHSGPLRGSARWLC